MYKYNSQQAPERYTKLIPLVKVLILVLSPWGKFEIPKKPLIYFLPTYEQYTLTELLSNAKCRSNTEYVKAKTEFLSDWILDSEGGTQEPISLNTET